MLARFETKVALILVLFLCEIFFAKVYPVTFMLVMLYWINRILTKFIWKYTFFYECII